MGSYLSIITLNVNGLNAPTKKQRLAEWIQKQDPYICCLQESESEVTQSCLTLCDPMDCRLPGSSVRGILQARVLEWVAISFSFSHVQLFGTPWTVAHQSPLSMEFSRQEDWSGLPFPSPGDLPDPRIKPRSPALQAALYHLGH